MNNLLTIGQVLGSRYLIEGSIGEGGMQRVYRARDSVLDRFVALKTPKNSSAEKRFKRSAVVAAKVNHPNVAKTLDYFEEGNSAVLIEELVEGGDLQKCVLDRVDYLDPYMVACIFHRLSKGLAASHRVSVIHRDMKPTNVMVAGDLNVSAIKITDFGIAKMADDELAEAAEQGEETMSSSATAVGALPYMAPEAIETPRDVTCAVDIWSLGAMMYELLTGIKPFGVGLKAVGRIVQGKREDPPSFVETNPQFSHLSKELLRIIDRCLTLDADSRPNADELVSMCENLCYSIQERHTGRVKLIKYNKWGFLSRPLGPDAFYHRKCVYGSLPSEGDGVVFSTHIGGKAPRAYPVVKLK